MLSEMNEVWSYLLYNKVYEGRHIGMLDNFLIKLFFEGKCLEAYKVFGAHPDKKGVRFTVYAPHARSVQVVGNFNEHNIIWRDIMMEACGLSILKG